MSLARIRIVIGDAGDAQLEAELFDDLCPGTVSAILGALPITGIVSRWGDEIYFSTSVIAPEENQNGAEIRPASAVNVFGRIVGDATVLERVCEGERIVIDR
jgi:hypothetical protein